MTFYERFKTLSKSIGKKPTSVGNDLGISSGTISAWKEGTVPNGAMLAKLSDYFGVSVDYLLLGKEPIVYSTSDLETEIFESIQLLVDPALRRLILRLEGRLPSEIEKVNRFLDILGLGGSDNG